MSQQSSQDPLQQVGNIWKFLDKMSAKNPEEYQKFINNVLKEGEENDLGPPSPKFVVQTVKVPEVIPVRKYFINITEWKQVPAPKAKDSPIPIVISEQRKEIIDKEWASVLDVALNPTVFSKGDNIIENTALIELALQYIEQKLHITLSRKYKTLDETYKGNQDNLLNFICPTALKDSISQTVNMNNNNDSMFEQLTTKVRTKNENNEFIKSMPTKQTNNSTKETKTSRSDTQRIKSEATKHENEAKSTCFDPMITANLVPVSIIEKTTKTLSNPVKQKKLTTPKVEMVVDNEEQTVKISIELPGVYSVTECDLDLSEQNVSLVVTDKYELDLDLPLDVLVDDSKAKFIKDQALLLLTAPYLPSLKK